MGKLKLKQYKILSLEASDLYERMNYDGKVIKLIMEHLILILF